MADNVTITPGSGATIAADEVAGALHQRMKLSVGADGSATDLAFGQATMAASLPVTLASNQPAVAISDGGGSITVDGVLTDAQLRASAVAVSAAALPLPAGAATEASLATIAGAVDTVDVAASATGVLMLAQRRDADTSIVDATGDATPLAIDELGRLKVASQPPSLSAITGSITASAQTVAGDVSRVSNVVFHVSGTFAGHNVAFEASIDGTNWFAIQVVRSNANTIETTSGALSATPAYSWEASVNGYTNVRVRATAHTSGTASWRIQPGSYATEPIPAAQASATQPVSGTVTANIGTGSIAAGTNAIGDVGLQARANATGAATIRHLVSAASTNATSVKAGAGRVLGWALANTSAAWRYVKLHNTAAVPTAGAGVVLTIAIPPGGVAQFDLGVGIGFATGIGLTAVTGSADADATAVAAGDIVGDLYFA